MIGLENSDKRWYFISFRFCFSYNCDRLPAQYNDQITCHWCSEQRLREIHEGLYPNNPPQN